MADTSMMIDRAREKTAQMPARASAIDQLIDSGTLGQIGVDSSADIDRQLQASASDGAVTAQLDSMKRQLAASTSAGMLQAPTRIVRIQGEDRTKCIGPRATRHYRPPSNTRSSLGNGKQSAWARSAPEWLIAAYATCNTLFIGVRTGASAGQAQAH